MTYKEERIIGTTEEDKYIQLVIFLDEDTILESVV